MKKQYSIPLIAAILLLSYNSSEAQVAPKSKTGLTVEQLEALPHMELMALVTEPPKDTVKTIGILLYDGYYQLDAIGPHSVLSSLSGTRVFFVAREKGMVTSSSGLATRVDTTMAEVTHLDMLIVPGGFIETYKATKDEALLAWIRDIDETSKYTTSVCTGAWILGAAGLLEGKEATTNWYRAEEKLAEYGAKFVRSRYTNDGKYWTSAGVTAGMDMSLALVKKIRGDNYTQFVMLNLEYDPDPPIEAGHPDKADPAIVVMTRKMYDWGLEKVIN